VSVDPLDHGRVDAGAAGEDEISAVGHAEVDLSRSPLVDHSQQVLGCVDDVVGDAERAADDVG